VKANSTNVLVAAVFLWILVFGRNVVFGQPALLLPPAAVPDNSVTAAQADQSLLAGCSYIGQGGCPLPASWTLVGQQDFECKNSHAIPPNPSCSSLPGNQDRSPGTNFESKQAHGGMYGFGGQYFADGNEIKWQLNQGAIGTFQAIYISYWEYTDPNAQYGNSDYYLFHMVSPTQCAGLIQDIAYDAQNPSGGGAPPTPATFMLPIANGNTSGASCQGYYQWANGGRNLPMMAGQWRQVEIVYTPSTSTSGPQANTPNVHCNSPTTSGCGNGTLQLFINGRLWQQSLNANLNGTTSMANSDVEIGGVITDFCDAGANVRANPFSACPGKAPTPFNRYFDDIIILKK
jgi:hypothetical protein